MQTTGQDNLPPVMNYANDKRLDAAQWRFALRFRRLLPLPVALASLIALDTLYSLLRDPPYDPHFWRPLLLSASAFAPILIAKPGIRTRILALLLMFLLPLLHLAGDRLSLNWLLVTTLPLVLASLFASILWLAPEIKIDLPLALRLLLFTAALTALALSAADFLHLSSPLLATLLPLRVSQLLIPALFVSLLWLAIPFLLAATRGHLLTAACFSLLIAGSLSYFFTARYWIADFSFLVGVPFERDAAAQLLAAHDPSNARFWDVVEHADWNWPCGSDDPRTLSIEFLIDRDPTAPRRLVSFLLAHPAPALADAEADMIARDHLYAAAPLLLRYALWFQSARCTEALAALNLPQAAWPIYFNYQSTHPMVATPAFKAAQRATLARLLGVKEIPPRPDWLQLLHSKAHGPRPPVPPTVTTDADHLVDVYLRCVQAEDHLASLRLQRVRQLAAAQGLSSDFNTYLEMRKRFPAAPIVKLVDDQPLLDLFIKADNELRRRLPSPLVYTPATPAFLHEFDLYCDRIDALPAPAPITPLPDRTSDFSP